MKKFLESLYNDFATEWADEAERRVFDKYRELEIEFEKGLDQKQRSNLSDLLMLFDAYKALEIQRGIEYGFKIACLFMHSVEKCEIVDERKDMQ